MIELFLRKQSDGVNIVWRCDGKISCEGKLLMIVRMRFLMDFDNITYITNEVLGVRRREDERASFGSVLEKSWVYIYWQWLQEHVPLLWKPFLEPS